MRAAGIAEAYPWRLRELIQGRRRYLRLSQEAVAARLEISARAYGNWERGVVKEWTDQKLYSLAEALEMTQFQTVRLFRLAVDRVPQPQLRSPVRGMSTGTSVSALLEDYRVLIEAQSLPAFLIDHGWNVRMSNGAFRMLFEGVSRRPASMPATNFLRFGLFHPDAAKVLEGDTAWKLSILAQLAVSLECYDSDPALQVMRREVYLDPRLRDMYLNDVPAWICGPGSDLIHQEDLRLIRHPDPELGLRGCRFVEETPRALQALGFKRITLVLQEVDAPSEAERSGCRPFCHAA
ncbi:helix-turn-helix domain-containing protein [Streptomyces zhihengii]|uniref:Helix-turn-helix domain-containing protein n=1 Tax=Streptomyces zhihengii TaxID=1818004 RepID=A0ABS2V2J2_9ACTN|nr:helix-turn-helix domain-containing protein [Streptomyces zhihengii]MBM9624066.1 helix-turn-helix domain-containing protein [Streptomyces zhihengii]